MRRPPKYVSQLSLKEMALRWSVVLLWNELDTLRSIIEFIPMSFSDGQLFEQWYEEIQLPVERKVSELKLPEELKKQMIDIMKPIGVQIRKWKRLFESAVLDWPKRTNLPTLAKLCWNSTGTLDYRKTAERLIRSDILDVVERYKLASVYCFEEDIRPLWEELPEEEKERFCNGKYIHLQLHLCWPHILKGELSNLDYLLTASERVMTSFNQYAFEESARGGNKAATEYFFQKLTDEERNVSLMRTAHAVVGYHPDHYMLDFPMEKLADILCYLLSFMTPQQQMDLAKSQPASFWLRFFIWPFTDLFAENTDLMWAEIDPSRYEDLLVKMSGKVCNSAWYFPKMFQEFFQRSPPGFKTHFVTSIYGTDMIPAASYFYYFFHHDDPETIKLIFKHTAAAERVRIILNHEVLGVFQKFILEDKWNIMEVCLREAELSKEDKGIVKDAFIVYLRNDTREHVKIADRKLERFFELLN